MGEQPWTAHERTHATLNVVPVGAVRVSARADAGTDGVNVFQGGPAPSSAESATLLSGPAADATHLRKSRLSELIYGQRYVAPAQMERKATAVRSK